MKFPSFVPNSRRSDVKNQNNGFNVRKIYQTLMSQTFAGTVNQYLFLNKVVHLRPSEYPKKFKYNNLLLARAFRCFVSDSLARFFFIFMKARYQASTDFLNLE
jgi:hypothetical protein